ncbi:MAG: RNA polymerase sigma-70 factor [Odoribacter sp.]
MEENNTVSFKFLFEEYYPSLVKVAFFYVNDVALAEDITQEVFAKLLEKRNQIATIENIKGYLQYAVKNRCINHLEHSRVVEKYNQEYLKRSQESEDSTEEYINLVHNLVEKLPLKRKTILKMSVVEAKSYQEIATELDMSINTVKGHIKKAYAFLREEMKKEVSNYILYMAFVRK